MSRVPLRDRTGALAATVRSGMSRATLSLFDHAPYPLEHTLDFPDDPGLLGPDSISWAVLADVAAFVGGLRGLLIQAAHPEVVAGVEQHSRYRDDPFGRLSRTSAYVTATTYGAMPEVDQAVSQVRRIHRVVRGVSSRGVPYDAADPGYSAWVHNVLTDSFLHANQVYGGHPLSAADADRFVAEQTRIGALLGADPMPETAVELRAWVTDHPEVAPSPAMEDVVEFLADPPLSRGIKVGYSTLLEAAVAITPERLRRTLGVRSRPGSRVVGKTAVATLRWALGYSPSWALALRRNGSALPENTFRRTPHEERAPT
ncbi:MAG: oxygenase MpaB family protein [Acidimicrobiia bacterium]